MKSIATTILSAAIALLTVATGYAQSGVLTGSYVPPDAAYENDNYFKRVIPYPHLREADVMYKKRVWQDIDLEQKFNQPFYYPQEPIANRKNLIDVIKMGLEEERIIAYAPINLDDEFRHPILTKDEVNALFTKTDQIDVYDQVTLDYLGKKDTIAPINFENIKRYRIKEEWIWDKQRSERYVRILGIAPMMLEMEGDVELGYTPMFWLYYPHCREWFASDEAEVYNIFNDAQRRTYEDLFQKRYFSSYIIKEDNAFDRYISKYATDPLWQLAESERIQQELFNLEHDLWHY